MRPALMKYSVTALDPGARLVFTHGLEERPRSTAFLASSPAASIRGGFDVFVQLVMAAITTEPWCRRCFSLSISIWMLAGRFCGWVMACAAPIAVLAPPSPARRG